MRLGGIVLFRGVVVGVAKANKVQRCNVQRCNVVRCKVQRCKVERCNMERCKVKRCKVARYKVCWKNKVDWNKVRIRIEPCLQRLCGQGSRPRGVTNPVYNARVEGSSTLSTTNHAREEWTHRGSNSRYSGRTNIQKSSTRPNNLGPLLQRRYSRP